MVVAWLGTKMSLAYEFADTPRNELGESIGANRILGKR